MIWNSNVTMDMSFVRFRIYFIVCLCINMTINSLNSSSVIRVLLSAVGVDRDLRDRNNIVEKLSII